MSQHWAVKEHEILTTYIICCCDIEKISNIDIEKKIPVISIFSIFSCREIIRIKI